MVQDYFPYGYSSSVFDIDFEKLYRDGYKGLILDIDNTFVHHGDDATEETDELIRHIQSVGFKIIFLSDNSRKRVERFLKNVNALYISEAGKPHTANYYKAVEMLGLPKEKIICIGDQIFVDIVGANRSGIPNILVKFIKLESEKRIGKKRYIEKFILFFCRKFTSYCNRLGNISKGR